MTAITSASLEGTDLKDGKLPAEQICDPVSGSSTTSPNSLPLRDDRYTLCIFNYIPTYCLPGSTSFKKKNTFFFPDMLSFCFRGFESETDTEEFEKVGQSPTDMDRIATTVATSEVGVQSVCYQDIGIQCNSQKIPLQTGSGRSGDSFSMSMDRDVCDLQKVNLVDVGIQFDGESDASVLCGSESPSDVPTPSTSSSLFPATDSGIQCDTLLGSCLRTSSTISQGAADVAVQVSSPEACASPFPRLIAIGSRFDFSSSPAAAADVAIQCTSPSSATSSFLADRSWHIRGPRHQSTSEMCSNVATQSSSPILLSPSQSHGQQHVTTEFLATEFYMDESMPSSFTESNSLRSHNVSDIEKHVQDSQTLVRLLQVLQ